MNYIRHLHAFYHQVKHDDRLTAYHVSLYMAIFQYWNYNRFQNPFRIDRDDLMLLSRIGSKNTYHKYMKELHHYQYIIYHSGITKYQNVKVSMPRLDLKSEVKGLKQLELFGSIVTGKANAFLEVKPESSPLPLGEELRGAQCTAFDTPQCPTNDAACVPSLTGTCPNNGINCVSNLGHNIKHKQINDKPCVIKTEKNTPTQIFEKNKIEGNAVSNVAGIDQPMGMQNQGTSSVKNSAHLPEKAGLCLPQVEIYFRENNFPIQEAQKFFYYNKGRGWMLTDTLPVNDWQALAQKWMLNNQTPKFVQNDHIHQQKQHVDPGAGKDYSEPL